MENLRSLLGRNVRWLRLKRGWTLEELADRAGMHANYLGDVERGRRNVSVSSLEKIARGLGVEPSALLKGAEKPAPNAAEPLYSEARRFLSLVRDRSGEQRRALLRILREAARGMEKT